MKVRLVILLLALTGCPPTHMTSTEWRDKAPAAPCEMVETYTDAMGADRRVSKYTADGRLVFAETRLHYDGHGFEHVTWKNDRVVRIDSFYETAFRAGNCDVEGGCDEPATRTIDTSRYRYDAAGHLIALDHEKREFRERGTQWVEYDDESREHRYVYDANRLVAIEGGEGGDANYTWSNGHPVARHFNHMRSTYEWKANRLVMYRWFDYEQSFAYDASGRLVREVLASKSDPTPTITEWTYDDAGRLVSEVRKTRNEERPTVWTYDDKGRVTSAAQDGRVNRTFEYGAACPANLRSVRAPSAEERANLAVCIRSPGYGYDRCFYDQR
jgi:YD repeat-containing protein